ncbi:hypothetical protein [Pseudonocardia sp. ICBG601]|uniref:hypothetical protein n=1 Tax=Pseudonocardia sp. ICBG601 TaxID=2846759 RepID=UPI0027E3B163|nr:hypothetical protein [Pseudonocardia sp. ICBG601]
MSEALWQELPEAHRDAMTRAGEETSRHLCAVMGEQTAQARSTLEDGGMTFTALTAAQQQRWQDAVASVRADWAADMEARGRPGRAALEEMEAALDRARDETPEAAR